MGISLKDYQIEAVHKLNNGSILCGGVGSGKSRTALAYYYILEGGILESEEYYPMNDSPRDLYIITTAKKRDTLEWEKELAPFLLSTKSESNTYSNQIFIDSWNNISKYKDVRNAFFIFDEQRVVGTGTWVKAFLKITKSNGWILLTATPGDTWSDYIPVFIANGFYKNVTEFRQTHIVYSRFTKYPSIDRYINDGRLIRLRNRILIKMNYKNHSVPHHEDIYVDYDLLEYKWLIKNRWNKDKEQPIESASEMCGELRKIVNKHPSRAEKVINIAKEKQRVIIFYNFDYELEILKNLDYGEEFQIAEWNGHKHQPIPESEKWIYLVQYNAGAEGWNCIKTDTIIFYSQNYSYKVMVQSSGRIDRMNTPYTNLYYYHLKSRSGIDLAISKALRHKKKFNETGFIKDKFTCTSDTNRKGA